MTHRPDSVSHPEFDVGFVAGLEAARDHYLKALEEIVEMGTAYADSQELVAIAHEAIQWVCHPSKRENR